MAATVTETIVIDRSTALQQGTREFAGVYERHAYLVYNLALRTTVDRAAAIDAASAAFLACLNSADADAEIAPVTVRRALMLAKQTATPEAAGDAEAQRLLSRTERLPAPERAVLALEMLASADVAAIAASLETTEEAAAKLIERAWSGFARACELPLGPAKDAYRGWLWAEPPAELWELLYPSFYEHLVRRVNAQNGDADASSGATAVLAGVAPRPSRSERRRARRAEKDARRAKPPGRVRRATRTIPLRWTAVAVGILAAGAGTAYAAGLFGSQSAHQPPAATTYAPQQPQMSAAELARLRAQQRQAEQNYAAQQRASLGQLSLQQKVARAAYLQQRAAQLAAAKRRQAAAKRAQQPAAPQPTAAAPVVPAPPAIPQPSQPGPASSRTTPANQGSSGSGGSGGGGSGGGGSASHGPGSSEGGGASNPTPGQVQQQCLYDANNGSWVCPQNQ